MIFVRFSGEVFKVGLEIGECLWRKESSGGGGAKRGFVTGLANFAAIRYNGGGKSEWRTGTGVVRGRFIKGSGRFQVDGDVIDVREGTVIRVAPEGTRAWRNNSSEDLYYIVL